ncbi:hypothetical protein JCGZ_01503 [Jatropha curcas]|uniref:Enhancer of polycomb-like protein n=1 Tax=Jatropha curcas TaxID=180498 RepID=A0A067LCM3_JATCU|nr:uncharacterized protein LOC105648015 [Jatropha curcas]KDP45003.1 hypothetical protein JCGZ_01503 [Jatropha curcas]
MPSVGMRRTTRVFGLVKKVDGPRVLRSGRQLPGSGDGKFRRANDGDEWLHTMIKASNTTTTATNKNHHHNTSSVKYKVNGWTHVSKLKHEAPAVDTQLPKRVAKRVKKSETPNDTRDKMFGLVYIRKRKRVVVDKQENAESKMFGIQFSRRHRRRRQGDSGSLVGVERALRTLVVEGPCSSGLASLLNLVFGYVRRTSLRISQLAGFLSSEPVSGAFASNGICFLQDTTSNRTGICKIFGASCSVPLFSLDFSAVPSCFVYMHLSLLFKFKCLPVNTPLDEDSCDEESEDDPSCVLVELDEDPSCVLVKPDVVPETDKSANKVGLHPSASKIAGRSGQYRNGINSRGIQKRRSSLRRRRARNPSLVGLHKANGALVSDLISSRKNGIPFSSIVSKNKLRFSAQSSPAGEISPIALEATQAMDSSSCSANVLVIESDRCYRIERATVTLEISDAREWVLVVKKDGVTRFTHLAQKGMRPCSSNRITHDIIWTGDESWKLEFPNRQDWFTFKDLYKECFDRNVPSPISKAIPVPGVCEVLGYEDSDNVPFSRPDVYISLNNDEVARALANKSANYDMDSEDEEWLKKFNNEFSVETEHQEHLSEDNFELMIDAFEKAFYCSPDDFADEREAVNHCLEFGRRETVEALYGYWMKKRKQRRGPLLKVFQGQQTKKAPLIPKPVLRKRRSLKRQTSQFGRGKQPSLLQAMAAEHDALEEQNAMRKVEAAKASAQKSVESAILKRRRAQMLMENADLAIYKSLMALRIAEAARMANLTDVIGDLYD